MGPDSEGEEDEVNGLLAEWCILSLIYHFIVSSYTSWFNQRWHVIKILYIMPSIKRMEIANYVHKHMDFTRNPTFSMRSRTRPATRIPTLRISSVKFSSNDIDNWTDAWKKK
jgi:hypothetical protein